MIAPNMIQAVSNYIAMNSSKVQRLKLIGWKEKAVILTQRYIQKALTSQ